jgi:hypothetical protein
MILKLQETWPVELINFLNDKFEQLMKFAEYEENQMKEYLDPNNNIPLALMPENPWHWHQQQAIEEVSNLLQSTTLRGWHCTRITESEVEHITQNGMQLPNLEMLKNRISQLQVEKKISDEIAISLKSNNYADEKCRKNMIWFCFFYPRLAHQSGLEIFFRYWGGESLSRAHQQDAKTKEILMNIGQPCLIEVNVPISALGLNTYLPEKIIFQYLINCGLKTDKDIDHEDKSFQPISAKNISRFIFYDDPEFIELVGCDQWTPSL